MWALWGVPMLVSTEVRNMSAWKKSVLTHADIIAINQDDLQSPGYRVRADNATGVQLWAKKLAGGDVAVVLYNRDDAAPRDVSVAWTEVGWPAAAPVRIYDVWTHAVVNASAVGGGTARAVPPHGQRMWRLSRA